MRCPVTAASATTQPAATSPGQCYALVDTTTDGGKTWHEKALGNGQPEVIQFVGDTDGWASVLLDPGCVNPCPSALYHTADGGEHWNVIYQASL
jgi:photosystem II stability/assembly factor-like uncharacterized protein